LFQFLCITGLILKKEIAGKLVYEQLQKKKILTKNIFWEKKNAHKIGIVYFWFLLLALA
jgi:hypothetical protein